MDGVRLRSLAWELEKAGTDLVALRRHPAVGAFLEHARRLRPGFELGLEMQRICAGNPQARGMIMGQHGLINWANDDKECYELTLDLIFLVTYGLLFAVLILGCLLYSLWLLPPNYLAARNLHAGSNRSGSSAAAWRPTSRAGWSSRSTSRLRCRHPGRIA